MKAVAWQDGAVIYTAFPRQVSEKSQLALTKADVTRETTPVLAVNATEIYTRSLEALQRRKAMASTRLTGRKGRMNRIRTTAEAANPITPVVTSAIFLERYLCRV
jgi:hypothetical protein